MIDKLPIYILAGGRSSRFGSDKANAMLAGQTLLERLIEWLYPLATKLTVVTRRGTGYPTIHSRQIEDEFDFLGPVAGILRALKDFRDSNIDTDFGWVLMVPCDLVNWDSDWVNRLKASTESSRDLALQPLSHGNKLDEGSAGYLAVCFSDEMERWQPFPGLYHVDLIALLEKSLSAERLSLQSLLNDRECRARRVSLDGLTEIVCANTPDELRSSSGEALTPDVSENLDRR